MELARLEMASTQIHLRNILLQCMRHPGFAITINYYWDEEPYIKEKELFLSWFVSRGLTPSKWPTSLGCPDGVNFSKVKELAFDTIDYNSNVLLLLVAECV